ncbi:MAG: PAS domain S-box protein [Gammaproteobacteria bacterium]|nr:PAS domain S-box protein [Gammaproteobacteria bacterium]
MTSATPDPLRAFALEPGDGLTQAAQLAERLGIGLLREAPPHPLNRTMERVLAQTSGALSLHPGVAVWPTANGTGRRVRITRLHLDGLAVLAVAPLRRGTPLPAGGVHPFLRLDRHGRIEFANPPGRELIDYAGAPALEVRLRTAVPEAIARGEWSVDVTLGPRLFSFVLVSVDDDSLHAYGREVSERRFVEAALRASEARLSALIEAAPDAIVITTREGRIEYVNPLAERMFGFGRGELIGRGIARLIPQWFDAPPLRAVLDGAVAPGAAANLHDEALTARRKDDSRFPVEVSASAMAQNGRHYITAIVRDVAERERAAREIRQLNEHLARHVERLTSLNRDLESFSYTVSHDLRAPLRSIDGFSALLVEDYADKLDEQGCDWLQRIHLAATRMSDLIDGLLRLSRITRADLVREPVDLSALATSIAETLRASAPARAVTFHIAPDLHCQADRAMATVLLENLLGNAWKFTAACARAQIHVARARTKGREVFVVSDNGAGFDMRYAGKLFKPFERLHGRDYPGTGIGLATVQRIVQRHGGEIWVESKEGEGTRFYFTL